MWLQPSQEEKGVGSDEVRGNYRPDGVVTASSHSASGICLPRINFSLKFCGSIKTYRNDSGVSFQLPGEKGFKPHHEYLPLTAWFPFSSKNCFQAEDVGAAGEGDFLQQEQKTSDCSLAKGLLPPKGCLRGWLRGGQERGETPRLPCPPRDGSYLQNLSHVNWFFFLKQGQASGFCEP